MSHESKQPYLEEVERNLFKFQVSVSYPYDR